MYGYHMEKDFVVIPKIEAICRATNKSGKKDIIDLAFQYNMGNPHVSVQDIAKKLGIKDHTVLYDQVSSGNRSVLAAMPESVDTDRYLKMQSALSQLCYYYLKCTTSLPPDPRLAADILVYEACSESIDNIYIDMTTINNVFGSITGLLPVLVPGIRWLIPTYSEKNDGDSTISLTTINVVWQERISKEIYK